MNRLTSLPDLSANTALTYLWCDCNQLTSLPDLSIDTVLNVLYCFQNKLDFSDARELRIADALPNLFSSFWYSSQDPFGQKDTIYTCIGDTLVLSIAAQDSAISYQWFLNGNTIEGANDTTLIIHDVTKADLGAYTCKSYGTALQQPPMIHGTGISEFVSESILVNSLQLNLSKAYFCLNDEPIVLSGEPKGGIFSGPGVTDSIFSPIDAGEGYHYISYSYTDRHNRITTDTKSVSVTICTSVQQTDANSEISVFPNPTTRLLHIEAGQFAGYELYDNMGRLVAKSTERTIDFIDYEESIYIVKLIDKSGNYCSKKVMYIR
jgi:hypothetical protein